MHWSFWPDEPSTVVIRRGEEMAVTVRKNYFKALSNVQQCEEEEDYRYPQCVVKWARESFGRMFKDANKTG